MRLPPAPWLLLALLFLVAVPPPARPLPPHHALAAPALTADPPTQTVDITITASGADPQAITVTGGTTVRWRNVDSIAHTITADDGSFGPFPLGNLDTAAHTFDAAGTYTYTISAVPAAASTGTIVVTGGGSAATATPSPTWTASPSATPSATMTTSPTPTITPSATPTRTPSATPTASSSPTSTASNTATPTATQTPTGTPTDTASATATPLPPDTALVTIADTGFVPQVITVTAGMYVEWTNAQPSAVTITSTSKIFGSDPIPPGGSYRMRFAQTGSYGYSLAGSNGFTGTVVVLPAPSPTVGATQTTSPTASATSSVTATASPTASATGSATTTAFDTATPSATVAVVDIPLSGDPPSPCTPTIQTGGAVRWSNENGADGPTYYLEGLSPSFFTSFGIAIDPGQSASLAVVVPGTYTYRISSAGRVLVPAATFVVGDTTLPCPTPTSTLTASATPTGTSTPTSTAGAPATPTATRAANTATATPTDMSTPSPSATPNNTPTPSPTASPRPSDTPTTTPTSSPSATPMASATNTPTHTPTMTPTATWTATATSTPMPPASPTATEAPPATAGSVPPPATPTGAAGATPTRAASAAEPTPPPVPRRSSTPAAAPRQRCLVIVPRHAAGTVTVNGYVRRGHGRVDLTISLPIRLSTKHGTLRLRDPAARLALTSTRIVRVRLACDNLRVDGLSRIGKRTIPFTVEIQAGRHGLTLTASVPARHYRFSSAFHGHLAVHLTHKSPQKHGANGRSSKSGSSTGHGGKKATAPGRNVEPLCTLQIATMTTLGHCEGGT